MSEHPGFTSMEVLAILNDTPMPEGSQWVRRDDYPEPPESPSERSEREQDERAEVEYGVGECEF